MNVNLYIIEDYENKTAFRLRKNKPNSNPVLSAVEWANFKPEPTFSDAIATVRRLFWQKTIFEKASYHKGFKKLSPKLRNLLLDYLAQAA